MTDIEFCTSCGRKAEAGAQFCGGCGSPIGTDGATEQKSHPTVNFALAVYLAFTNSTRFSGRSTRAEYFWFMLFYFGCYYTLLFLTGAGFITWVFAAIGVLPFTSVSCRRLHDMGRTGWLQLPLWIPVLGLLYALWLACRPSQPYDNKYGPR